MRALRNAVGIGVAAAAVVGLAACGAVPVPEKALPTSIAEIDARIAPALAAAGSVTINTYYGEPGMSPLDLGRAPGTRAEVIYGPDGSTAAMNLTVIEDGLTTQSVVVGDTVYVYNTDEAPGMWVSVTRDEMERHPEVAALQTLIDDVDPFHGAEVLDAAVTSFRHTAHDGVDVFTATLDPARLDSSAAGTPLLEDEEAGRVDSITCEITLSQEDSRPVEVVTTVTVDGATAEITTNYLHWGEVLPIEEPFPMDVVSYSDAVAQG